MGKTNTPMNKRDFLSALEEGLSGLPESDITRSLDYYGEMIDDRIEDGLSEEEAVSAVGSVSDCVAQILADIPLSRIVKERVRPKRPLRGLEIALIVIGSPVWFPLLLAGSIIVLALYIVAFSFVAVVWAITVSLAAASAAGVFRFALDLAGSAPAAFFMLGIALFAAGLAIVSFISSENFTKVMLKLCVMPFTALKAHIVRKGGAE